jgi:hypothetical protein
MKPNNEIKKQAVRDFYGQGGKDLTTMMKYLIRGNKPKLTEEQKDDLWYIRQNLSDPVYREGLKKSLGI